MVFTTGKSCLTNLIAFYDKITSYVVRREKWIPLTLSLARFLTRCLTIILSPSWDVTIWIAGQLDRKKLVGKKLLWFNG